MSSHWFTFQIAVMTTAEPGQRQEPRAALTEWRQGPKYLGHFPPLSRLTLGVLHPKWNSQDSKQVLLWGDGVSPTPCSAPRSFPIPFRGSSGHRRAHRTCGHVLLRVLALCPISALLHSDQVGFLLISPRPACAHPQPFALLSWLVQPAPWPSRRHPAFASSELCVALSCRPFCHL